MNAFQSRRRATAGFIINFNTSSSSRSSMASSSEVSSTSEVDVPGSSLLFVPNTVHADGTTTTTTSSSSSSMQEYILVPGCTHDALEEQWKIVYGYNDDGTYDDAAASGAAPEAASATSAVITAVAKDSSSTTTSSSSSSVHHHQNSSTTERNLERGGLVFWDGRVNPGHFCFETKEENSKKLSPISKIIVMHNNNNNNPQKRKKTKTNRRTSTTAGNDINTTTKNESDDYDGGQGGLQGRVRVGRCCDVSAGWDHTDINGYDPTTFHYASLVFGHFHIHADDATGEINTIRRIEEQQQQEEEDDCDTIQSEDELLPLKPLLLPPSPPPQIRLSSMAASDDHHQQPYVSVPSCGDVAAWLMYHRNVSRAFVVTRTTSWFFEKIKVDGHAKDGIECPYHIVEPWVVQLQDYEHEPIAVTTHHKVGRCNFECIYRQMLQHGFGIFTKHLSFFDDSTTTGTTTATAAATKMDDSDDPDDGEDDDDDERLYTLWRPFIDV